LTTGFCNETITGEITWLPSEVWLQRRGQKANTTSFAGNYSKRHKEKTWKSIKNQNNHCPDYLPSHRLSVSKHKVAPVHAMKA
jgi:hypothetical protein